VLSFLPVFVQHDISTLWNDKRQRINSLSVHMNAIYKNRTTWEEFEDFCCVCSSQDMDRT
jgi:hypothetical protein